jgi:hypothetical protein
MSEVLLNTLEVSLREDFRSRNGVPQSLLAVLSLRSGVAMVP